MAKADTGTDKSARHGKGKRPEKRIPKTIAGVKLPKDVRRAGDALLAKAATPEGKALIAGGLSMAVAGIAAATERRKPAAAPHQPAGTAETSSTGGTTRDPESIVDAIESTISRLLKRP